MIRALAPLLLAAAPALAFDGTYGNCAGTGDDVPIRIEGDLILFYESVCQLTNPVLVRDMDGAVLFDVLCRGEGEEWGYRAFLQRTTDGGLILVREGIAQQLPLCP